MSILSIIFRKKDLARRVGNVEAFPSPLRVYVRAATVISLGEKVSACTNGGRR
jgi:hypothetical protein